MKQKFSDAEVVAVDFSSRSIAIARESQRRVAGMQSIRFEVADLTGRTLPRKIGRGFDFISCHGVLSYILKPEEAIDTLARCLAADGILYLGANGAQHSSVSSRRFLAALDVDVRTYREGGRLRCLLSLFDHVAGDRVQSPLAGKAAGYLASDLFGPVVHNLPLSEWIAKTAAAGLHFQGSLWGHHAIRNAIGNAAFARLLIPRSRSELCELFDCVQPAPFHHMLFTATAPRGVPWQDHAALLNCRPVWTGLYQCRLPAKSAPRRGMREIVLKSRSTNTELEWRVPEWELEFLRGARNRRKEESVASIFRRSGLKAPPRLLRDQLYLLHQLAVISMDVAE